MESSTEPVVSQACCWRELTVPAFRQACLPGRGDCQNGFYIIYESTDLYEQFLYKLTELCNRVTKLCIHGCVCRTLLTV